MCRRRHSLRHIPYLPNGPIAIVFGIFLTCRMDPSLCGRQLIDNDRMVALEGVVCRLSGKIVRIARRDRKSTKRFVVGQGAYGAPQVAQLAFQRAQGLLSFFPDILAPFVYSCLSSQTSLRPSYISRVRRCMAINCCTSMPVSMPDSSPGNCIVAIALAFLIRSQNPTDNLQIPTLSVIFHISLSAEDSFT